MHLGVSSSPAVRPRGRRARDGTLLPANEAVAVNSPLCWTSYVEQMRWLPGSPPPGVSIYRPELEGFDLMFTVFQGLGGIVNRSTLMIITVQLHDHVVTCEAKQLVLCNESNRPTKTTADNKQYGKKRNVFGSSAAHVMHPRASQSAI
ncbi:hypothetical protein OPT61_g5576 [Boeremia exigua]|uniref:Uncharacterized protein n=1 Tax=Boeremia exigua TaxID=749465 RepID=A0ACC2I9X6_9PLEO|nr:hypothetical protein OPT61_g5576 [Boeremia exigua]